MKPNNVKSSVLQKKKASSQSDAPPYILKIKGLRLKGKYPYPAITYFEERLQSFGNLGCHKGCGQCFKCQTSIKFSDTAVIAYFQNLSSAQTAANELGGKYTYFKNLEKNIYFFPLLYFASTGSDVSSVFILKKNFPTRTLLKLGLSTSHYDSD